MRRLALALLATFALAIPDQASAQLFTWDYLCNVGNVQACASFSLALQYDPVPQPSGLSQLIPEGVTRATFAVRNLQGLYSGRTGTEPWQFTRFGFLGMATSWTTPLRFDDPYLWWDAVYGVPGGPGYISQMATLGADRPADSVGDGSFPWEMYSERQAALPNGLYSSSLIAQALSDVGGFYGCDQPGSEWLSESSQGSGGWWGGCDTTFYVNMVLPGRWSMTDATQVTWSGRSISGRFRCTVGVDCAYASVPEPAGGVLLATGLLGFAVVRRRRATA